MAVPRILFRRVIKKNLIKKELEYIELPTEKKKNNNTLSFTISFYKYSNFELLYDNSL